MEIALRRTAENVEKLQAENSRLREALEEMKAKHENHVSDIKIHYKVSVFLLIKCLH